MSAIKDGWQNNESHLVFTGVTIANPRRVAAWDLGFDAFPNREHAIVYEPATSDPRRHIHAVGRTWDALIPLGDEEAPSYDPRRMYVTIRELPADFKASESEGEHVVGLLNYCPPSPISGDPDLVGDDVAIGDAEPAVGRFALTILLSRQHFEGLFDSLEVGATISVTFYVRVLHPTRNAYLARLDHEASTFGVPIDTERKRAFEHVGVSNISVHQPTTPVPSAERRKRDHARQEESRQIHVETRQLVKKIYTAVKWIAVLAIFIALATLDMADR